MEDNIFSPQISTFEPFASNVDSSRTNMSAKQLLQTVVGDKSDTPFIINRNYSELSTVDSPYIKFADDDGYILYSSNNMMFIIYWSDEKKGIFESFYVPKMKKLVNNSLTLRYLNKSHQFKKGDCLFDYTNQIIENNLPRIGYRAKIGYASFFGYCAEDALVISKSFAEKTTIDYSDTILIPITPELKYFKNDHGKYFFQQGETIDDESLASYLKIDTTKHPYNEFSNISNKKSKIFQKYINILMHCNIVNVKVHPYIANKSKEDLESFKNMVNSDISELKNNYFYTPDIIDEIQLLLNKQKTIKEDMLKSVNAALPQSGMLDDIINSNFEHYIQCENLQKKTIDDMLMKFNITEDNLDFVLEFEVARKEPSKRGDKFANLFAGKGTVSLILNDDLMPTDDEGNPMEVIVNPAGIFRRNNWGTIFESDLTKILRDVEKTISNKNETLKKIKFIRTNFIKNINDEEYYIAVGELISNWNEQYVNFKNDVMKHGFYLYVGNFPKITYHDFYTNFLLKYENHFKVNITKKEKLHYSKKLIQYLRNSNFYSNVFDKDCVYEQTVDCRIAENYFLKLYHTAYSKYNSIAGATKFSASNGQMAKGRSEDGGGHASWQTSAALMDRTSGSLVLKEFFTVKADCIEDKNRLNEDIMLNGNFIMKDKYSSKTKEVVDVGLRMNGMSLQGIVKKTKQQEIQEDIDIDSLFEE